eukprot:352309-Chlamydomonas_euryale.AAC.4
MVCPRCRSTEPCSDGSVRRFQRLALSGQLPSVSNAEPSIGDAHNANCATADAGAAAGSGAGASAPVPASEPVPPLTAAAAMAAAAAAPASRAAQNAAAAAAGVGGPLPPSAARVSSSAASQNLGKVLNLRACASQAAEEEKKGEVTGQCSSQDMLATSADQQGLDPMPGRLECMP